MNDPGSPLAPAIREIMMIKDPKTGRALVSGAAAVPVDERGETFYTLTVIIVADAPSNMSRLIRGILNRLAVGLLVSLEFRHTNPEPKPPEEDPLS